MLGRLFRQQSSSSLHKEPPPASSSGLGTSANSYEDSYTREILYGVSEKRILNPYDLNSKLFRILVSQDGGSLRSKQVLFDSAHEDKPLSAAPKSNLTRSIMSPKIHHNPNELHDYMFGCGLPTNELHSITKIHMLPVSSQYGSSRCVLVTRLFSITDFQDSTISPGSPSSNESQEIGVWCPRPTLPINTTKISVHPSSTASVSATSTKNNVTSRFAVGLIIPLDDNVTEVIANNWHEICHFLIVLQKTVSKKMIGVINQNEHMPYIQNKRIQFPSYILANDMDIQSNLLKLIKLINYNANIPKLVNSNSLMKLCLRDTGVSKYNPMVLNWVLEILNWLEFKELNESSKFLSSLLALVISYRYSLTERPFSHDYSSRGKEITRIVVMTGNPMVAKKLMFILNGMIADEDVLNMLGGTTGSLEKQISLDNFRSPLEEAVDIGGTVPNSPTQETDVDTDIDEEDEEEIENISSPSSPTSSPPLFAAHPIPIKSKPSQSFSSSENSFSNISHKGWEIPGKATPVTSTSVSNSSTPVPKNIPISRPQRGSLSKSSSMAYLSSSLNSSLSSSASNYSLSKLGGSFIDKWRNQFNSSVNYDNIDYQPPGHGSFGGHSFGGNSLGKPYGGIGRKLTSQTMKTPSPALEIEGFHLSPSSSPSPVLSATPTLPSPISNGGPNGSPALLSTIPTGIRSVSKTQSMFDLYHADSFSGKHSTRLETNAISRSKASIYENHQFTANSLKINRKIDHIMETAPHFEVASETTLNVPEPDPFPAHQLAAYEDLPPSVAFTDEFRPEFVLQSCPINPRLEQQIISSMKNDLLFHQNNCHVDNITTRTIFVSLRAREVKLIEMKIGDDPSTVVTTPAAMSTSPLGSYFPEPAVPRRSAAPYKTTVKKVYGPGKHQGDGALVGLVEQNLHAMRELLARGADSGVSQSSPDFSAALCALVSNLLC
ncbi:hypothetical protein PSN45_000894 [Yamadazyma tenuis]|uniref:Protein LST4 n=1 Tax=Candida tenuis (strain ATCC 10573 / BCRC 21748 / CBS 615 / JCM 9827 / NBRC 10315 / NRRL Y-1498 / VKM Y-70) TaxID=590646 RepID=G3BBE9_CANTC|nr:uncharacterized protein CANTEDRAFT_95064 [Yamadazyma tenuis ATCC 10573]EGV62173.1 hypothetical protein CANTEDRAFT_95064 [Yamadazyma tenuis ATCC 10573]WEJ93431.1 hypothetical protein PSN45_000894 [Yamadazyma tenuis]